MQQRNLIMIHRYPLLSRSPFGPLTKEGQSDELTSIYEAGRRIERYFVLMMIAYGTHCPFFSA